MPLLLLSYCLIIAYTNYAFFIIVYALPFMIVYDRFHRP
jgi:hypothetical protein